MRSPDNSITYYSPNKRKKYIAWATTLEIRFPWKDKSKIDMGFCFFLNFEDAEKIRREWQKSFGEKEFVCLKIKYKDGIGKHMENGIVSDCNVEIALCKQFALFNTEDINKFKF